MSLEFATALRQPFQAGDPVAVLLHGRGSNMHDLLGLRPAVPDRVAIVAPQAPYPGAPWGYGSGWAWYRYVRGDQVVPETLEGSLGALDEFVPSLARILGAEPGPIVLGGFSQGGTTSLAYGLSRPGRVRAVANFSGFYVSEPAIPVPAAGVAPPVFWGHGQADPAIPFSLAVEGRSRLVQAGVALDARDYAIGHWIGPDELADFAEWLETQLA